MAANEAIPKYKDHIQSSYGNSKFIIGHDFSSPKSTLKSVFKKDFPEHDHYEKADIAQRPKLGDVMHKDERIHQKASETYESFEYQSIPKPVLLNIANKLSYTNFKMDSDTSKINSFFTTHKDMYKPQMGDKFTPLDIIKTSQVSSIPQGDKEKAELPISDYKYKFPGIDTNKFRIDKAGCKHDEGPPTIKGDDRLGHFTSVSRTQFEGKWTPKVETLPVPRTQNVPVGDPDKENTKLSVMQSSFLNHTQMLEKYQPFDTDAVSHLLRKTNYKEKDDNKVWNNYETTTSTSFTPKSAPVSRGSPSKHRNASDFPTGDREPIRDKERLSLTTSRFYHGNPALGLHNKIVTGADKRTKSDVLFGDPSQGGCFYSTSTKEVFQPKSVPFTYSRQKCYVPSSVPLHYYGESTYEPTAASDYTAPNQKRLLPNPATLDSIQGSHIHPPQRHMMFETTHKEEFTPKRFQGHKYDSGRLQKSSIPLGTMTF